MTTSFLTVSGTLVETIIIQKSKFICHIAPAKTAAEAEGFIESIRKKHYNATHNVPAYIVDEEYKYSDDGEPSQTAGAPVLNTLQREGYNHIAVVITRYFGGIKLGTGGLVRAYTDSLKSGLEKAAKSGKLLNVTGGIELPVELDYQYYGAVERLAQTSDVYSISESEFLETVRLKIWVDPFGDTNAGSGASQPITDSENLLQILKGKLTEITAGSVIINKERELLIARGAKGRIRGEYEKKLD